ncbi:MAG: VRR-NUC domain-containing protein [Neomegalonema sp.]|nr:VRR-NUC domain-containing protein [Neomegalonema sp.]
MKRKHLQLKSTSSAEREIQVSFFRAWGAHAPTNAIAFACENGAPREPYQAKRLKEAGMLPGAADVAVVAEGGLIGFLEFKSDGGRLSPAQHRFRDECAKLGAPYHVVRSVEDALRAAMEIGAIFKPGMRLAEPIS